MKFPLYLYYELIVRLSEYRPDIGEYHSIFAAESTVLLKTDQGTLEVPSELLFRQFNDPDKISKEEIRQLAKQFQIENKIRNLAG